MGQFEKAVKTHQEVIARNPEYSVPFVVYAELVMLYSELGREKEAQAEAAKLLKLAPHFSVDVWGQRAPYKDPAQAERDMAALRRAGLK